MQPFSTSHRQNLSNIARDLGQVFAASIVVPAVVDRPNVLTAFIGLFLALVAWSMSHLLLIAPPSP